MSSNWKSVNWTRTSQQAKLWITSLNSHFARINSGTKYIVGHQAEGIPKNPHRPRPYHILCFALHITLLEVTILVRYLTAILPCCRFSISEAIVVLLWWSVSPPRADFVERTRWSIYFLQSRQLPSASSISITFRIWGKRKYLFIIVKWGHFSWQKVRHELMRWSIMTLTSS